MTPTVSVIIPNYDDTRTLSRPLAAVHREDVDTQTIVVDNTDEQAAHRLVDLYDAQLVSQPPQSPAKNRMAGVEYADGDYVMFLDADDSFVRGAIERRVAALEDSDASVAICECEHIYPNAKDRLTLAPDPETASLALFRSEAEVVIHAALARREVLDETPMDTSIERLEDWEWLVRVLRDHPVVRVSEARVRYHYHDEQRSGQDIPAKIREKRESVAKLVDRYPELEPHADAQRAREAYNGARVALRNGDVDDARWLAREAVREGAAGWKPYAVRLASLLPGGSVGVRWGERLHRSVAYWRGDIR